MSHNIKDEKCVYSLNEEMWHRLGFVSKVPQKAKEVMTNSPFDGGFRVELRQATVTLNGIPTPTNYYAIVRVASPADPKEVVFDVCTERYHPLQPMDVCESFDQWVNQPVETLAFLGQGEEMFISWKLPEFEITKNDFVRLFGVVRVGYTTMKSARLFTAIHRPVCENTVVMAEGWAVENTTEDGAGYVYKGKASNANLLEHLGYWMGHIEAKAEREVATLKEFLTTLATTPIVSDDEAKVLLYTAYPDKANDSANFPVQLRDKRNAEKTAANESIAEIRNGIFRLWQGAGTAISRDRWGLLNATSEYFNHYQPSKKPIAYSVMFGPRYKNILAMVETLAGKR